MTGNTARDSRAMRLWPMKKVTMGRTPKARTVVSARG
jgi:hypothetical protein